MCIRDRTTTAVLAMSSTISKLGWGSGAAPKLISTIVVVGLVVVAGIFGYDLIMRCQQVITIVTGVITVGFFILGWGHIDFDAIGRIPSGGLPAMLGCCFFVMTGFGLGWVNIAADYSRYLPRKSSNSGIVFWTTFGASIANVPVSYTHLDVYKRQVILRLRRIGRQHRPHSHTNGGRRGSGGGQDACQCVAGGWRHARGRRRIGGIALREGNRVGREKTRIRDACHRESDRTGQRGAWRRSTTPNA